MLTDRVLFLTITKCKDSLCIFESRFRENQMNIDQPLKDLGSIDYEPLRDAIINLDEDVWHENETRQEIFDVHKKTSSLMLVFCDGWPELKVKKEDAWDRLAKVAVPLMEDVINKFYEPGGTIIRAMAAKLYAGERITPHVDKHPSFAIAHRIPIPITTNEHVRFTIAGRPYRLQLGRGYEVNNQSTHSVMNRGKDDRITFIFDYMPPEIRAKAKSLN